MRSGATRAGRTDVEAPRSLGAENAAGAVNAAQREIAQSARVQTKTARIFCRGRLGEAAEPFICFWAPTAGPAQFRQVGSLGTENRGRSMSALSAPRNLGRRKVADLVKSSSNGFPFFLARDSEDSMR